MNNQAFFENLRNDFPILKRKIRGKPLIYLDSAATSQKPREVIDEISRFYQNYNANIHRGIYQIAEEATKNFEETREKIAEFIGADSPSEIIFTRNTTEAINLVAYTFAERNLKRGENIITTLMEHHSNFLPWQQLSQKKKANLLIAPITKDGHLDLFKLLKLVNKKTKLVAITHASNVLGTINPLKEIIGEIKKKNPKTKVLIDGAQSLPHLKVNVKALNCDFLAFSAHKMLGPAGVGVLYGKREILERMPPFLTGGHMIKDVRVKKTEFNELPWKFEAGTQSIAEVIAFRKALGYLEKISMGKIREYLENLTSYALSKLETLPEIEIYGPKNPRERVSLISFNLKRIHPHDLAQFLDRENIAIRAGHHCAILLHQFFGVRASVRASFYIYNNRSEVDKLVEVLKKAKKFFK